jgi:hypothetical protein
MAQRSSDLMTSGGESGLVRKNTDVSSEGADIEDISLSADDASGETENIKAQIEETRAGMGETIDAIQEKLSLTNISEQVSERVNSAIETAKDTVYDATVGKAVHFMKNTGREISNSSLVTAAKENPLPFILIGLGAGMLAYQGFSKRGNGAVIGGPRPQRFTGGEPRERSIIRSAQGGIRSVRDTVSHAAGTAYDGVAHAAETTYHNAGDLAHRAMEKAGDLGTKAQETYNHYLEEKPWAIAAVALAAGAAIGMAIPSTRYEGELMGEARVNLLNKVQDSANEFIDKAKQTADEAGRAISEGAKSLADETLG